MKVLVEKADLMRLREYAQWRDSIDAVHLIDRILADEKPDYIDEHPAARGRRFTP